MSAETTTTSRRDRREKPPGRAPSSSSTRFALVVAALATIALYFVPYGQYVIYPLMLFSTYVHEMGHGLTAELVGGDFVNFQMWQDGSGVAMHRGHYNGLQLATVAAGGLLGPAIAGALFFVLGRWTRAARAGLFAFGVASVVAMLWVVENGFALGFVGGVAALCLAVGYFAPAWLARIVVVFVAMQLSVSAFSRGDYLFMEYAETSAGRMPSDVTQMANALAGPYWLWGGLVAALSLASLVGGFWFFFRGEKQRAEA